MRYLASAILLLCSFACSPHLKSSTPFAPVAPTTPEEKTIAAQIAYWERRLPRDPEDHTAAQRLAMAYLSKARSAGDFAYYRKAEALLEPLSVLPDADYSTLTLLASAKAAQHKFRPAAALAEQARDLLPHEAMAYAILFDARLELGELKAADAALRKLSTLEPGFPSLTRAANYQLITGQVDAARASLEAAIEDAQRLDLSKDQIAWSHVRLGVTHYNHGGYEVAEQHYAKALALTPASPLALEHMAELRASQGRLDESLELYTRVLGLAPTAPFFEASAEVLAQMGNSSAAEAHYAKAEQTALEGLKAGDIGEYRYLAEFYSDTKPAPALALQYARADLEVRQDIHTYQTLAWALYRARMFSDALAAIKQALSSGAREAGMLCHASAIYAANNQNAHAASYKAQAREANSRFKSADCGIS